MASKKYTGKLCAYCCSKLATTADHVFAREFFIEAARYTPIKVPACAACNGEKSKLEHHLTALLPFGGTHIDARTNLEVNVPKRLARNAKLSRSLSERASKAWIRQNNRYVETMSLPLDFTYIEELFKFIVKGLALHHWGVRLTSDNFLVVLGLSNHGEHEFDRRFFHANVASRVKNDLAHGTFLYQGVQGIDNPAVTAWRFQIYGGLVLAGDPKALDQVSTIIGAFSGTISALRNPEIKAKFIP